MLQPDLGLGLQAAGIDIGIQSLSPPLTPSEGIGISSIRLLRFSLPYRVLEYSLSRIPYYYGTQHFFLRFLAASLVRKHFDSSESPPSEEY